jgi:hypothetical protein
MFVAPRAGRRADLALLVFLAGCALGAAACGDSRSSGTGGKGGTGTQIGGGARGGATAGSGGVAGTGTGGTSGLPADAGVDPVGDASATDLAGGPGGHAGAGGAAAGGGTSAGGAGGAGGIAGVEGTGATAGTGAGSAGRGGEGGQAAGGADGGAAPLPSAGCATANAHPSERAIDSTFGLEIWRKFPSAYDGVTPMPLIFALHATNYPASGMTTYLVKDQPMADRYVVVAPQESPNLFPSNFESRKAADFSAMLTNVLNELCIDQRRVFGVGNGSGGRAVIKWSSTSSAQVGIPALRGIAMVGTYIVGFQAAPLPLIFIHPLTSSNSAGVAGDADGAKAIKAFRTRNACGESSVSVSAASCSAGGMPVDPGCVDFDGCAQPLRFCHHDDLTGQSGGDPWSCVATPAIYQFFSRFL